jgi:hypothetical protein
MAQPAFASVQDKRAASAECFHGKQDLDVNCLTLLLRALRHSSDM